MNAHQLRSVLLRRLYVVPIAVLGVLAAALLASAATTSSEHVAEGVVVVRAGAEGSNPGEPTNASVLASTYVRSIPEDGGVIRAVAEATDQPADDTADRISALGTVDTALIRLRFGADDRSLALDGAQALITAVTGETPAARSVGRRVLSEIRAPRIVDAPSSSGSTLVVVSVVLGLLLALIVILGLERSDPRIDTVDELADEIDTGITHLRHVDHTNVELLLTRLVELSPRPADPAYPVRVGLIPAEGMHLSRDVALRLRLIAAAGECPVTLNGEWDDGRAADHAASSLAPMLDLVTAHPAGSSGPLAGERVARNVDVVALVVPEGLRERTLATTLRTLHEFGTESVQWAILARHEGIVGRDRSHEDGSHRPGVGARPAGGGGAPLDGRVRAPQSKPRAKSTT